MGRNVKVPVGVFSSHCEETLQNDYLIHKYDHGMLWNRYERDLKYAKSAREMCGITGIYSVCSCFEKDIGGCSRIGLWYV